MQIAFHLRRRTEVAPVSALLLCSPNMADLAQLLVRLRADPLPPTYRVADGFLVKLATPAAGALGGLRLRALADNLFVPVDADLLPALLPEEAADLVRHRGLVVLPGGRVLEFDPDGPLPLSDLLTAAAIRRERWRSLPEPPPLADRLTEITLEQPEVPPDDILAPGGDGIGTEDPRPDDVHLGAKILGKTAFSAGKALAWLGNALGAKGLARTGVKWMEAGLAWSPRLAEPALGEQEARLRELLRAFQRGDVERALRRALPIGGSGRGGKPATGARLPFHNLLYSLRNILGDADTPASLWLTQDNLYEELGRAYRRQAELAAERGDYRRAAFIYAKLLRDYRAAAAVLSKGGLHQDAAILYLKRLDDTLAAAREYEAAGDIDRALALYRRVGEHVLAGDLLKRAGEKEQALVEFQTAAKRILAAGKGHHAAGEVLRTHAGRLDLALPYYEKGWAARPADNPTACAIRMAQAYAKEGNVEKLLHLTAEATAFLAPPGNDAPAADFYNELARLAKGLRSAQCQEDLRDCALMGLAGKLRQRVESNKAGVALASSMLGASQVWDPAVVNDAQFALSQAGVHARRSLARRGKASP